MKGFGKYLAGFLTGLFLLSSGSGVFAAKLSQDVASPSGIMTHSERISGTVEDTNSLTRSITLRRQDGTTDKIKVGREVKNFSDIKKGDLVKVEYFESMATAFARKGATEESKSVTEIEISKIGEKPAKRTVEITRVAAIVDSVDPVKRTVTLKYPDGNKRTVRVYEKVSRFDDVKTGDEVVVQITESYAISLKKG